MTNDAKLSFHGAAGQVTGSCYLLRYRGSSVLVDCGFFQGDRKADVNNRKLPPVRAQSIDAVMLSHAHLDHCGRLPVLVKAGFRGPIYATSATIEVASIILRDSASIQESDAKKETRQRQRAGKRSVGPLYTGEDVERTIRLFRQFEYDDRLELVPGVTVRIVDAGHILGAGSLQIDLHEPGKGATNTAARTIVFSADVGPNGSPILRDPVRFKHADVLVMESTYGDRDHKPLDESIDELARVLSTAIGGGGKVLIPAFAVGRTQDIVYHLGALLREGRVPQCPVYVDSPMATATTRLYQDHRELYDEEALGLLEKQLAPLKFPGLRYVKSAEESRSLNDRGGCVVIAASGMCTGGRIMHHLRHGLWKEQTQLVFVGYQAHGTMGRQLVDGAKSVRIFGERIVVKARVHTLGGFSAHAGQRELVEWCRPLAADPERRPEVYLTHGEDGPRRALAGKLKSELGLSCHLPGMDDVVGL